MRETKILYKVIGVGVLAILVLGGCVSVPNSPAPRFYILQPISDDKSASRFNIGYDKIIGVGPVEIPEYLSRPQIVTLDKDKMLAFAQFDRWGENLDLALQELLNEYLSRMLSGATIQNYPWNLAIPVRYQVAVDVLQLESELDSDMFLAAQWTVIDAQAKKMLFIKRSEFRLPIQPQNYAGLARTLSRAWALLSSEIAEKLAALAAEPVGAP